MAVLTLLVTCGQQQETGVAVSTPDEALQEYGLRISKLEVRGGMITGTVKNETSRRYKSLVLWVHVYDAQGARLTQASVGLQDLWPGETVKIDSFGGNDALKGTSAEVKQVRIQ